MSDKQLKSAIYDAFSCTGGDCPYTCCRDWNYVLIDDATMQTYRKMPDILSHVDQKRQCFRMRREDNSCHFLNEDRLCNLVLRYGDRILCKTCAVFPRLTAQQSGVTEFTVSNACAEAIRLLDHTACPLPFIFEGEVFPDTYVSSQAVRIRNCMIDILQIKDLPLYVKLQLLYMFAQRLATGDTEKTVLSFSEPALISALASRIKTIPFRIELIMPTLHNLFNAFSEKSKQRMPYPEYLEPFFNQTMDIDRDRFEKTRAQLHNILSQKASLMENISVNYTFRHFADDNPELLLERLICLALELALSSYTLFLRLLGGKDITDRDIYVVFSFFSRVIEHNEESMEVYTKRLLSELGFNASDFYLLVRFLQCGLENTER